MNLTVRRQRLRQSTVTGAFAERLGLRLAVPGGQVDRRYPRQVISDSSSSSSSLA